jgi:uncharacterized protein YbjT (DUF2867 family)
MLLALTGATGFIGQPAAGIAQGWPPRARAATSPRRGAIAAASAVVGDLARPQNMSATLEGVDAATHSAGLARAMSGISEGDYHP